MNLDRNIHPNGKGKYALINLRKIPGDPRTAEELAAAILANPECVEFGEVGGPDEFFVLKLKDLFADSGLLGYSHRARIEGETEYAQQVFGLARRSGRLNPWCKRPD